MENKKTKSAVEALLFAQGEPVTVGQLADVLEIPQRDVLYFLETLRQEYDREERGICLLRLEEKWQMATRPEYGAIIRKILDKSRNAPLSAAAMETLTVIAYNQPVSRSFIEQVRGVDSSSSVSVLLDRGLIEEAGRLELPGRPVSFRTTDVFLRAFGLETLADLPPLAEKAEGERK